MANWLDLKNVEAPSSADRSELVEYAISRTFVEKNNDNRRCSPIFQLWVHVLGALPPINAISKVENGELKPTLTTLLDSTACFSGLNRPHDNEENGDSVLIYVLNPEVSIKFQDSMSCLATAVTVPKNTVLTVQVRPKTSGQPLEEGVKGLVTRLEFVSSSSDEPTLPRGYQERYNEFLWQK